MASKEIRELRFRAFALVIALASAVIGTLTYTPFEAIRDLECRTWDWRLQATANAPDQASPVRIITIDQRSLDYLADHEQLYWPWPRGVYEVVLSYLKKAGAKAVAFDILFTEPSSYGVEDDTSFATALKSSIPSVLAMSMRQQVSDESVEDITLFSKRQAMQGKLPMNVQEATSLPGVTLPISPFLHAATALGDVRGESDRDGVFRQTYGFSYFKDQAVLGLPFALFKEAFPDKEEHLQSILEGDYKKIIRFYGPARTIETDSFVNIFISWQNILGGHAPAIPLERYKDAVVIVGMDAPGLLDLRPTPLAANFPGVEVNASVLQNIIDNSFIVDLPIHGNALLSLCLITLMTTIVLYLQGIVQATSVFALFSGYWMFTFYVADRGVWLPLAIPSLGMIAAMLICLSVQYVIEGRQYRYIRNAFKQYVSPAVIDKLIEDPSRLTLGGEKRELTIFFSDIAGFTSISESLDPGDLVALLNTYLTAVTDMILDSGGTVDKYVGDAVVAFWNAPVALESHAVAGVSIALKIQENLQRLSLEFQKKYGVAVETRIGLHTGEVSVGNFGSAKRFDYTVIGDAANLAARLESANKYFGTKIMISERTHELLEDSIPCRFIGRLKVVGKKRGIGVYEPRPAESSLEEEFLQSYHHAIGLFEEGELEAAQKAFLEYAEDSVSKRYLERIQSLLETGEALENPTWNLSSK